MSILEGVKAANIKAEKPKFIIKSKTNFKDTHEEIQYDGNNANDVDTVQFIEYMIAKSSRLAELLENKKIKNQEQFCKKHLYGSICLRTMLKQTLDKMMMDRRLGKNLKGMNKSNLVEIENTVWSIIQRQANLYNNELEYNRKRKDLEENLRKRKQSLQIEINELVEKRARKGSQNVTTQEQPQA